uniref:Peptidase M3A/M3B catalytic domain-containing protein n=1 Tax=Haptolina brevifila TaxID=156173 RepID=A0A7S2JKB6_9EUKA|mmetsp:Transcript_83954/g.167565  ORF Transcript_83954/g.167565 Transcript_83954/m.167565 type:complete len:193 (+) Transcript_83954:187-765(+)
MGFDEGVTALSDGWWVLIDHRCWQPSVLARLSKHHTRGDPLPEALREALVGAKNVMSSMGMLRQIYLATLDLALHATDPPTSADGLQQIVDKLRPEITGIPNPPGANFLRSFGHLMNQYSAAYYGYMWAEVISADMFASRFEEDCMSKEAGMAYRKQVLAPGGTGKIMDHLTKFLGGRPPKQEPFLKARGIL